MSKVSARKLKEKYPALWKQVYDMVLDDVVNGRNAQRSTP